MSIRMMQRAGASVLAPVLAASGWLLLPHSVAKAQHPVASFGPSARAADLSDAETNQALDELAKELAAAVESRDVRETLHGAIKKRFDGDTNALWSSLAGNPAFNRSFNEGVGGESSAEARRSASSVASSMPRLQIAVPAKFASWDPVAYAPLVAFFPRGVDDTTLETITAYDSQGNAVQLDAQVAPEQPVIVLSLNERIDEDGNVVTRSTDARDTKTTDTSVAAAATNAYGVALYAAYLAKDNEPWALGDAEIYFRAKSRGCSGVDHLDPNISALNNDGDWWGPGLNRSLGTTTCAVGVAWWEDDGGANHYELMIAGTGVGIGMDNDDDMIGKHEFPYSYFAGATQESYEWESLRQWLQ